jgi:DNA-binding MarR family transcriptional regulator
MAVMPRQQPAGRDLAVVLHDLAWLLPRTVGERGAGLEPLPATELEVMRLLVRRPGLSVNDVARELRMRPSNASTTVGSLVAQGKLRRRPDEADRRVVRLEPTRDALAARDKRESVWGEALAEVLTELLPADVQRLEAATPALRALAARLAALA